MNDKENILLEYAMCKTDNEKSDFYAKYSVTELEEIGLFAGKWEQTTFQRKSKAVNE